MPKFTFTERDGAWKSMSGKKWVRPLPLTMAGTTVRLFCDGLEVGDEIVAHDYDLDGRVIVDGQVRDKHLDNIIGGWTEPFARHKPIMESVTEVVEVQDAGPVTTTDFFATAPDERAVVGEDYVPRTTSLRSASHRRFDEILDDTILRIRSLSELKGGEYAGDLDRLANFRRNGAALDVPMEVVWAVYANKHHDAIMQYIKDLNNGTTRPRSEPISGRAIDLIVYLVLFLLMEDERTTGVVPNA